MAEQLWPRRIGRQGYVGGERLRTASSARSFGEAEREGGSESGQVE